MLHHLTDIIIYVISICLTISLVALAIRTLHAPSHRHCHLPIAIATIAASPSPSQVHMQSYLVKSDLRGCSDFLFVPGSNDCHLFVIRTEETLGRARNAPNPRLEPGPTARLEPGPAARLEPGPTPLSSARTAPAHTPFLPRRTSSGSEACFASDGRLL